MKRRLELALALTLLAVACAPVQEAPAELADDDRAMILKAIQRWEEGWAEKDHALAAEDYSDDADWTNAFGMRRIGRPEIEPLLEEVFALPFVMAGSTEYQFHDLSLVADETVLARSRAIRTGQQLPDGTVERPRRTNHLRVFQKRDGRWQIISHLISDERDTDRPRDDPPTEG